MRKMFLIVALVGLLTWLPAPADASSPLSVQVAAEPARVETVLGGRFMITTDYVDPEDWSPSRSQQLSLEPGESRKLSWELQAVNAGHLAAYVVVVPFGSQVAGNEELLISPLVNIAVASRSTLTARGALPVVISIPVLLGLAAAGVFFGARRRGAKE
jgi:hypothetical protein